MEFTVIFLFAAFAVGRGCMEGYQKAILFEASLDEFAGNSRVHSTVSDHLKMNAPLQGIVHYRKQDSNMWSKNSGKSVVRRNLKHAKQTEQYEMEECFTKNEDYLNECIFKVTSKVLSHALESNIVDGNVLQCRMYLLTSTCFVERIRVKCGRTVATVARKVLNDIPREIQTACEAAGVSPLLQVLFQEERAIWSF